MKRAFSSRPGAAVRRFFTKTQSTLATGVPLTSILFAIPLLASVAIAQSILPRKDIPAIAKAANGTIVSIVMSDKDGKPIVQGSGFLVSTDGRILTNYHVIAEGTSAVVKLPDGAFYVVDGVLAFDKARDVAVIKAHGENFRTLTLGNSDRVQVGQEVVAIGNPLSLESTVSNGIISSIRAIDEAGGKYLQVTAPISPGSSGGPLFNMEGQVIGITTMYLKGGENLNFAIPINDAKPLLEASSSKLEPFPNAAPEEEQQSATSAAANVQINSPSFKYYQDMLAAHEGDAIGSTYACFQDDPTNEHDAESFFLIRIWEYMDMWSADILNVRKVSVDSIFGYVHDGTLKLDANGEIDATFSSDDFLPYAGASDLDKAIHKDDYLEWGSHKISFQYRSYQPPANVPIGYFVISFTMGRPSGKYVMTYTPEGVTGNLETLSETGQCVRIPGSKTLEEKLQGSSQ